MSKKEYVPKTKSDHKLEDGAFDPEAPMGGPGKLGLILIGFILLAVGIPLILEWMGVPVSEIFDWVGHRFLPVDGTVPR
jgi:hypothetical protein